MIRARRMRCKSGLLHKFVCLLLKINNRYNGAASDETGLSNGRVILTVRNTVSL